MAHNDGKTKEVRDIVSLLPIFIVLACRIPPSLQPHRPEEPLQLPAVQPYTQIQVSQVTCIKTFHTKLVYNQNADYPRDHKGGL